MRKVLALLVVAAFAVLSTACAPTPTSPTILTTPTAQNVTTLVSPTAAPQAPAVSIPVPPDFDPTPQPVPLPPEFNPTPQPTPTRPPMPAPPVPTPAPVPSPLPFGLAFVTITLDPVSCGTADIIVGIVIDGRPQMDLVNGFVNTWKGGLSVGVPHLISATEMLSTHGASYGPQTVTIPADGLTIRLTCQR